MNKQPNILVFMSDDHAQWAARCYGNQEMYTPNLDGLAANGVLFQNAFTPCPVCSPARASFFTGRLPSQHGIHDYLYEGADPQKDWMKGEVSLAQILKENGYQTGLVGKWHCGRSEYRQPGFDFWFESHKIQHFGEHLFSTGDDKVKVEGYKAEAITEHTLRFLRDRKSDQPFFHFVGYIDTHSPFIDHPSRIMDRYRCSDFRDIPDETHVGKAWVRMGKPENSDQHRNELAKFYTSVTHLDEQIGTILKELKSLELLDHTLIVYTSDHGQMMGHHGLYTKGNATIPQNFYEESIRVPCLFHWPDRLKNGEVFSGMVNHCDLFQTLVEASESTLSESLLKSRNYPGKSFLRNLEKGGTEPWKSELYFEYGNARAIRTERWKYIERFPSHDTDAPDELYDLKADPREIENLVEKPECRETALGLKKKLEDYFKRYEMEERSGRKVLSLPAHNPFEPWRLPRVKPILRRPMTDFGYLYP